MERRVATMIIDIKTQKKIGKSFEDINLDRQIQHKKLGILIPRQFVEELELEIRLIMDPFFPSARKGFKDRKELKDWCICHQPSYKKYIPEVVSYFALKYDIPDVATSTT